MSRSVILSLFLIFFVASSQQLGTLYINDIIGNSDWSYVMVEESIFNDNSLTTTYINGLVSCTDPLYNGIHRNLPCGVYVEDVNYFDGNVDIPINLYVYLNTTIESTFYPNGGIRSDAFPNGGYSFLVEDNSGDTGMIGVLRLYGGIIADGGVFTVADDTGETTIETALLQPNGGINVQDGQFVVAAEDGTFYTSNSANVEGDFYLGTSVSEDRYITRFPDSSSFGGKTAILGQSAALQGGDLILEPGVGQDSIGKILLGRASPDDLYFGRPSVGIVAPGPGGITQINGQSSNYGNGGHIVFSSGDSSSSGNGGDLILDVGYGSPNHGVIVLGNTDSPGYDLMVYRPLLAVGPGGSTKIFGQTTNDGNAGDFYLKAGDAFGTGTSGGALHLSPGYTTSSQGNIVLGRDTPAEIIVSRYPSLATASNGGATTIKALDGSTDNGGDLFLRAGDAGGQGNGGNIYLQNGDVATPGAAGKIIIGDATGDENLLITRTNAFGAASNTYIVGQESLSNNGGSLILNAGDGATTGGNLNLNAGTGVSSLGGNAIITSGDGLANGGGVFVTTGSGNTGAAGSISVTAGSTTTTNALGGSVYLNAGSGSSLGSVTVSGGSGLVAAQGVSSILLGDSLQIYSNQQSTGLVFEANPESIVSFEGLTLIKDRQYSVQVVPAVVISPPTGTVAPYPITLELATLVAQIGSTVQNLNNALNQCGHGLIGTGTGSFYDCYLSGANLPGPIPTPVSL